MSKLFTRTIEDFDCGHCGAHVEGDGYTNHCPKCLWSKHVDKNPGDRAEACGGLMRPSAMETKAGKYSVLHKCEKCGFERRNLLRKEDDFDAAVAIAAKAGK